MYKSLGAWLYTPMDSAHVQHEDPSPPHKKPKLAQTEVETTAAFLTERDVGITEYIDTRHKGIFGILKQRYVDFIVHEITSTGNTAKLTSFDIPDHAQESDTVELQTLISSDDFQKCQELSRSTDKSSDVEFPVEDSKEIRTNIHKGIRKVFPNLDSRTIEKTKIRVFLRGKGSSNRSNWNCDNDYVRCVLYKENRDTMYAIATLSRMLRVKNSVFQCAGTKDKRAVTSQLVTVYRVSPKHLSTVNGANTGIRLGNFEYCKLPLKLGDMKGNHFTIVLRDVKVKEQGEDLTTMLTGIMNSLRERGFINYFGMQRFGTSAIPTHHIGRALLHSNWREAIDLILKPRDGELADFQAVREYFQKTKDAAETLKQFPTNKLNSVEYNVLKGLEKHGPNNLLAALSFLPRNSRTMYVHSYQSYVWNRMASFRLQQSDSLVPLPGDLVWIDNDQKKEQVELITEESCSLHTIYDVVLPLPGYDVIYPTNSVGTEYHRLLAEDGLTVDLRHRVKDFSLPGSYRHIMVRPGNLDWQLLTYDDFTIALSQTDLDILEGNSPPPDNPGGSKKALKLQFSLPSSTYATMALREVLKDDTSSHVQAQLNEPTGETTSPDEVVLEKTN